MVDLDKDSVFWKTLVSSPGTLLSALEGADVGVFVLGPDFRVQWINGATELYFGLSHEAVIDADKRSLIESTISSIFEQPERFAETVLATYDDNSYVEEFECHVQPDGAREERWLRHRSYPIEEGELAGGRLELYSDITEQKEHEQKLERQNKRLEQFASVVSHDLRNPLNTVSLRLELLREETDSDHIDRIQDGVDRMERIIEDMLWLAREGQDIGITEPTGVRESVEAAWRVVAGGRAQTELILADDPGTIRADADRLRQLLENLFSNAIEHGGSDVTVTVGTLTNGIYVADDGPGIPEHRREEIFESGYSTTPDGTGFGLNIVQQVVDAHGWEIEVTESTDGGTRFELTGIERI